MSTRLPRAASPRAAAPFSISVHHHAPDGEVQLLEPIETARVLRDGAGTVSSPDCFPLSPQMPLAIRSVAWQGSGLFWHSCVDGRDEVVLRIRSFRQDGNGRGPGPPHGPWFLRFAAWGALAILSIAASVAALGFAFIFWSGGNSLAAAVLGVSVLALWAVIVRAFPRK